MSKDRKHFVNLYGEPIEGSALTKFTCGPEFLLSAALASLPMILYRDSNTSLILGSLLTIGASHAKWKDNRELKEDLSKTFSTSHVNLCIDQKPDANSTPTKPEHMAASLIQRNKALRLGFSYIAYYSLVFGSLYGLSKILPKPEEPATPPPTIDIPPSIALFILGAVTVSLYSNVFVNPLKKLQTARRFNKVVKGDWVITDEPPPKTVTESLKDKLLRAADKLLPEPAASPTSRVSAPAVSDPEIQ